MDIEIEARALVLKLQAERFVGKLTPMEAYRIFELIVGYGNECAGEGINEPYPFR